MKCISTSYCACVEYVTPKTRGEKKWFLMKIRRSVVFSTLFFYSNTKSNKNVEKKSTETTSTYNRSIGRVAELIACLDCIFFYLRLYRTVWSVLDKGDAENQHVIELFSNKSCSRRALSCMQQFRARRALHNRCRRWMCRGGNLQGISQWWSFNQTVQAKGTDITWLCRGVGARGVFIVSATHRVFVENSKTTPAVSNGFINRRYKSSRVVVYV